MMTMIRLKIMNKLSYSRIVLATLILTMLTAACTSRYRLDLYLLEGEARTKIKVEKTEFMVGAVLGDPTSRNKVEQGDGNCLVLITGSRGRTLDTEAHNLASYDRYVRYRLFIQLAATVKAGSMTLKDNSLLQMLGRYEIAPEDKLYYPIGGELVVDSLAGNKLFGTIDGRFENRNGEPVALEGQFKAKTSD
ncbi:MAG: hypothetical protein J7J98_01110 [candidate division Zixibacteria bacterium]|nr:hypothetical protein [candidate division Zixibacteria bacterium]